jgi:HEAT repeat protein
MGFLTAIWMLSLVLSGTALTAVGAVMVLRWADTRRDRRSTARRGVALERLMAFLDGRADGAAVLAAAGGRTDVAADLVRELVGIVAGDDRERLVALLVVWDAPGRLLPALRARDRRRRREAAAALGLFDRDDVVAALRRALGDRDPEVRLAAARSLVEAGRPPPLDDLARAIVAGGGPVSQEWRGVFRRIAADGPDDFSAMTKADRPRDVRLFAIDALGRAAADGTLARLIDLFADPDVEIRAAALRALAVIGHPAATDVVRAGFADPAWEVRTQAAVTAGRIGLPDLNAVLEHQLHDGVWWPRYRAGQALARLGDDGLARLRALRDAGGPASRVADLALREAGA